MWCGFPAKQYYEWDKVKWPAIFQVRVERIDDENIKIVFKNNNVNNNYDVVGDSESDEDEKENIIEHVV